MPNQNALYNLAINLSLQTADLIKSTKETQNVMGGFVSNMKNNFKLMSTALLGAGGVIGAFEGYKKIMQSTEGSADKLESQLGYLQGSVQGVYETILSGDFKHLIRNAEEGAEATKQLVEAQDAYQDMIAGGALTRGRYERALASIKLEIAKTADPELKQKLITDALEFQKKINEIDVREKEKSVQNDVDYYQKKLGASSHYMDMLMQQIPVIAENIAAGMRDNIAPNWLEDQMNFYTNKIVELERYKKAFIERGVGSWTEVNDQNLKYYKQQLSFYDSFVDMRDNLSEPNQFNNFINGLAEVSKAISGGDENLRALNKQLTNTETKLEKIEELSYDLPQLLGRQSKPVGATPSTFSTPDLLGTIRSKYMPSIFAKTTKADTQIEQSIIDHYKEFTDRLNQVISEGFANVAQTLSEGLFTLAFQGKSTLPQFGTNILSAFSSMLDQLAGIAFGVAFGIKMIKKSLQSLNPALALAAGIALTALSAGAKAGIQAIGNNQEQRTVQYGNFANGGIVYGETFARVGEYSNARTNPEIIAPLDKLKGMLANDSAGILELKVKDDVLAFVLDRRTRKTKSYAV